MKKVQISQDNKLNTRINLKSFRFILLFCLLIVITAQALIMTTQLARNNQYQLQKLEAERQNLDIERGRLLLEKGALSSPIRVEKIAREKLDMQFPKSENIEMLNNDIK